MEELILIFFESMTSFWLFATVVSSMAAGWQMKSVHNECREWSEKRNPTPERVRSQ